MYNYLIKYFQSVKMSVLDDLLARVKKINPKLLMKVSARQDVIKILNILLEFGAAEEDVFSLHNLSLLFGPSCLPPANLLLFVDVEPRGIVSQAVLRDMISQTRDFFSCRVEPIIPSFEFELCHDL